MGAVLVLPFLKQMAGYQPSGVYVMGLAHMRFRSSPAIGRIIRSVELTAAPMESERRMVGVALLASVNLQAAASAADFHSNR